MKSDGTREFASGLITCCSSKGLPVYFISDEIREAKYNRRQSLFPINLILLIYLINYVQ